MQLLGRSAVGADPTKHLFLLAELPPSFPHCKHWRRARGWPGDAEMEQQAFCDLALTVRRE